MLILFFIVVIDLIGFGIIIPLLPFYGEFFHANPTTVGLLMATYSLGQFIAAPFWGNLSDRIGRKPVLLFSMIGSVLGYLLMGFAESLWLLFASRAIGGFMAGNISAAFAYIADVTTAENRAKGMGLIGAAFGLGFIIGPAIGGLLAGNDPATANYHYPAFAAAGLSFLAVIGTLFFLKESLSEEHRAKLASGPKKSRLHAFRQCLNNPALRQALLISFLATFAFAGLEATFAMWSRRQFGWGPEQNGYLFAFIGLISALIQGGLVGRLSRRFGEARLIVQGAAALSIGIALITISDTLPLLVLAMSIATYGFSIISPALNSLISLKTDAANQGSIMGATRSVTTMARVTGPAWAGYLFATLGMNWPYYAGALVMAAVCIMAIISLNGVFSDKS